MVLEQRGDKKAAGSAACNTLPFKVENGQVFIKKVKVSLFSSVDS